MKLVLLGCLMAAGGCTYLTPFKESDIPDRMDAVRIGQTDRAGVRDRLGNPVATSRFWGLDLFRSEATSQVEVPIFILPVGWIKDNLYRYTLVAYDSDGVVEAVDSGIYRSKSDWRLPVENSYLSLRLHAGSATFIIEEEDKSDGVILLPSGGRASLSETGSEGLSGCPVLISCNTRACSDTLRIDSDKAFLALWPEAIAVFPVLPGEHRIEFSSRRFSDKVSYDLSCRDAETVYLTIDAEEYRKDAIGSALEGFLFGLTLGSTRLDYVRWKVTAHSSAPEAFAHRPRILWRDGVWLSNPQVP